MVEEIRHPLASDLVPGSEPAVGRPGVVGTLRAILVLAAGLLIIDGGTALAGFTPLRAIVGVAAFGAGLAGTVLAFRALERRQAWALWYAIAVLLIFLVSGLWQVANPQTPGAVTIPIGSIVAALILLRVRDAWAQLLAFVEGSTSIGRAASLALAASIVFPVLAPGVVPGLADPTQVTAAGLALRLSVSCQPSPKEPDLQTVTATVTIIWAGHDVLPAGLAGALSGPRDHDQMLVQAVRIGGAPIDPTAPQEWALLDIPGAQPWLEPGFTWGADPGATVTLGGGPPNTPSSQILPDAVSPNISVSFVPDRMVTGQPYSATWHFVQRGPIPWPAVRARYVHESRFAVEATAGCGEAVNGSPAP